MNSSPPRLLMRFFRWFCDPDLAQYVEGDLIELYEYNVRNKGIKLAKVLFTLEVLKLFRPSIIKDAHGGKLNYYGMFKHNFKSGWRSILKHKSFSAINILGLSTGVAVCLVTLIFYRYETSFDSYHEQADQTYRVVQTINRGDSELHWNTTAYPLAAALRNDFPDFTHVTQTAGPMKRLFALPSEGET
ncbi:MAG: ABC transporter permease, partial [Ekhidna sp.]|nr:ABC transporter permease [Ekhidna sp.]